MDKYPANESFLIQFTEEEQPRVITYLQSRGCCYSEAEDLSSSVLLDFLLKIRTHTKILNQSTYLDFCKYAWGAIRNKALNFRRELVRKPSLLPLDVEIQDFSNSRINNLILSQDVERLVEASIAKLTPSLKTIAALAFMNDHDKNLSYHDLSLVLGISESAVKKNLQRARKLLRDDLEDDIKKITLLQESES